MEINFEMYKGKVKGKFLGPTEDNPNRHMYYVNGKRVPGATTFLGIKDKSAALVSYSKEQTIKHLLPTLIKSGSVNEEQLVQALYEDDRNTKVAKDLGSAIHSWIDDYIKHKLSKKNPMPEMPEDENILTGVTSFLDWESAHKVKFLWPDKVIYSLKYNYIGKADFGAIVDGKTCLCDIKTGNGMYNSVRAQTAAYAMADTEESKTKYEGRWAIRIAKETKEEYMKRMDLKNRIREILKKDPAPIEEYVTFEAKFLDEEKTAMKEDFAAFINHVELYRWDQKTDFWKAKQK